MKFKIKILCIVCCCLSLSFVVGCQIRSQNITVETSYIQSTEAVFAEFETSKLNVSATTIFQKPITTVGITQTTALSTTVEISTVPATSETNSVTMQNSVSATCAGLYNAKTMECLYENSVDNKIYPASLTKIVTACTALKYISPNTVFTVGTEQRLVPKGSSLCLIKPGHRLNLLDLLTGMLMCSGNDAAYTVAVNVAREVSGNTDMSDYEAVTYFTKLMNDFAVSIGAVNSNFLNPDGWDIENQYSTVYDLALISAYAIQIDEIRNIVSSQSKYVVFASGENITWHNTNALLQPDSKYYLPQAVGLKTGTTAKAGNCLIAVVDIDGDEYIAVVTGCKSNDERYASVHKLIKQIK